MSKVFVTRRNCIVILAFAFAAINCAMMVPHNFHNSMVQLKLNSKTKTVTITANFFANDLEQGVTKMNNKEVAIDDPNLKTYLLNYFKSKFQLKQQNKIADLKIVDFEMKEDVMELRITASNISTLKNATITNTLLNEIFDDQKNMVNIVENDKKLTLFFDNTKITQDVSY